MKRAAVWSLLFAVPLSGCGAGLFSTTDGYDRQGCVEEAMRKRPDPKLAEQAATEFELACRSGEAAACSALGVSRELGLGRTRDVSLARGLYLKACTEQNQRGCVNLANLEIAEPRSALAVAHAHELLFSACEAGEPSGCAAMAERLAKGEGVPKDLEKAGRMFAAGCDGGSARACFGLAEMRRVSGPKDQAGLLELFVKACVAGHQPACRRLSLPAKRFASR